MRKTKKELVAELEKLEKNLDARSQLLYERGKQLAFHERKEDHSDVRHIEPVECFRVTWVRGLGVENDPVREVTDYWTRDGVLLRRFDGSGESQNGVQVSSRPAQ